jgi:hypothetical protein
MLMAPLTNELNSCPQNHILSLECQLDVLAKHVLLYAKFTFIAITIHFRKQIAYFDLL